MLVALLLLILLGNIQILRNPPRGGGGHEVPVLANVNEMSTLNRVARVSRAGHASIAYRGSTFFKL